jgi:hypothetical protein
MQSDEDLKTTLSKWPFILGDVLLVATALAISILGDWQLSNWQVASCVMSVALGAGLFVLPYIVEFSVRIREEAEDRAADFRVLQRHLMRAEEQLESDGARIEHLEHTLSHVLEAAPATADFATSIQALEGRLERLEPLPQAQAEQSKQADMLASQLVALAKVVETKSAVEDHAGLRSELSALNAQLDALKVLKSELSELQSKQGLIDALQVRISDLQAQQEQFVQQLECLNSEVKAEATAQSDEVAEAIQLEDTVEFSEAVKPVEPKVKKTRETRKRRSPETRLLQRAIEEKQDRSSEAVSRIINAKSKPKPVTESHDRAESTNAATTVEASSKPVESTEPPVEATEPPVEATEPPVEATEPSEVAPQVEQLPIMDDMFKEVVPAPVKMRSRAKSGDTTVLASVFIGIGNKPYLRGSGGGLNWETGVAMEFEEIGKWSWIAPADLEAPIEIQIFRNDEGADTTGKHILTPGQKLELSPVF